MIDSFIDLSYRSKTCKLKNVIFDEAKTCNAIVFELSYQLAIFHPQWKLAKHRLFRNDIS